MKFNDDMIHKVRQALDSCLGDTVFARLVDEAAKPDMGNWQPDLALRISLPGNCAVDLVIKVKENGQPRHARTAVDQLLVYMNRFPAAYGIFVAPYISPDAGEICARAGIGYVDIAGNCRLEIERHPVYIYIRKEGVSNHFSEKRDLRSLYSPKASRVLRVLMANPERSWKVQELASAAKISLGQVSKVKKLLADRESIIETRNGMMLKTPEAVIMEWASNLRYSDKRLAQDFYSFQKPAEVESRLADLCDSEGIPYGLTEFSGAARVAPIVRYQRATAYIAGDVAQIADKLELTQVSIGANVRLFVPKDEGVFLESTIIGGIRIVSPVQLYLDLCRVPGRGDEAAAAVLEQVLRPSWTSTIKYSVGKVTNDQEG